MKNESGSRSSPGLPAVKLRLARMSFVVILAACSCDAPPVNSSTEETAVDPRIRLSDYLKHSEYPETSRPANSDSRDLAEMRPARGKSESARIENWGKPFLKDGSLQIPFTVDVKETGRYAFSTVVDRPGRGKFAVLSCDAELLPGRRTLFFVLFGKIIRDADYAAPLLIPGIAGERIATQADVDQALQNGKAPPEGRLVLFESKLEIAGYSVSDFSPAVWDSPEKRARIRELEEEISAMKGKK